MSGAGPVVGPAGNASGAGDCGPVDYGLVDPRLVDRIEAHSVYAWPPQVVERLPQGWLLRATPGLARGRSNHALTPSMALSLDAVDAGIEAAVQFADQWQVQLGLQISPIENHRDLIAAMLERGWRVDSEAVVMWARPSDVLACGDVAPLMLEFSDHASPEWLDAWACCEPARIPANPGSDIASHVDTVFSLMAGRARFAHLGRQAVGIAVDYEATTGLFCLAVAPELRRRGLGKGLVKGLLAGDEPRSTGGESAASSDFVYLQVLSDNLPGIALYRSLGFEPVYRYCHCLAPEPVAAVTGA